MIQYRNTVALILICLLAGCASQKTLNDDDKIAQRTAKINAQLGIAYLEKHNVQRAKQKLMLAIDQAPTIPEPWYSMAYFFEATGNKTLADTYYLKAIAVAPSRGDSQNNYGTFLCRTGDYDGAIKHFMLAIKDKDYLDPADAYENAGLCEMRVPNRALAMEYFKRSVMEDPRRSIALLKMAELEYGAKNYQSSDNYLEQYFRVATSPARESQALKSKLDKQLGRNLHTAIKPTLLEKKAALADAANELAAETGEIS